MVNVSWHSAPCGATHYDDFTGLWYRDSVDARLHYWDAGAGSWLPSCYASLGALISTSNPGVIVEHPATVPSVEQDKNGQSAAQYCDAAKGHVADRATTYDAPAGERSMAKTVAAFNALTGHQLTEEQGWLFMETLKMARSQQGQFKRDNYEDADGLKANIHWLRQDKDILSRRLTNADSKILYLQDKLEYANMRIETYIS